ncbi:MAG: hypothetical protein ABW072_18590 [Sedimenticola sp.]
MMRKSILSRYARNIAGKIILDVAAARVSDLYQNFDKVSPFLKKDLDPQLADYLLESLREIGKEPFEIRITLDEKPTEELMNRVKNSFASFFSYMEELEQRSMGYKARVSLLLFVAGIGFLSLAALVSDFISEDSSTIIHVFPEGITVAGWVALWNAIATFLIEWAPLRRRISTYRRLAAAKITISTDPSQK